MTIADVTFCLLRNELYGERLPLNTEYDVEGLIALAKRHDLSHLVADALVNNDILTADDKEYRRVNREKLFAVYRETQLEDAASAINKLFNENGIPYIYLKGAVVRSLYPEPWMRTSCDLDVLVKEEDFSRASDILLKNGFSTKNETTRYDLSFYYGKTHLELHHSLCRNSENINAVLSEVWDKAVPIRGYEYALEREFFVFHHVAHMLSHILDGGCGIRPFIDLWIMHKNGFYDEKALYVYLERCSLVTFYERVLYLSEVWMENKEYDETSERFGRFIISGGTYGTSRNGSIIGVAVNEKSKRKYLLRLAFPDGKFMSDVYPVLKKHKILLPFCYVHRVFSKLFGKERDRVKDRIKEINASSEGKVLEIGALVSDLGIDDKAFRQRL